MPANHQPRPDEPSIQRSLYLAWLVWVALLFVTLSTLLATLYVVEFRASPRAGDRNLAVSRGWFVLTYYLLAVPTALFFRGRMFRGYYRRQAVTPRKYLLGMSTVWAALAGGAVLALGVCMATRTQLPNILFAGVGTMMLLVLWPKGNAMTPPPANLEDPETYEAPS